MGAPFYVKEMERGNVVPDAVRTAKPEVCFGVIQNTARTRVVVRTTNSSVGLFSRRHAPR